MQIWEDVLVEEPAGFIVDLLVDAEDVSVARDLMGRNFRSKRDELMWRYERDILSNP